MPLLKRIAARLPVRWQAEMKRLHFRQQIRQGRFRTEEPEFEILHQFVGAGDWVFDIGANVGHYTKRLSDLVGAQGRVIAFEPVPTTFSLLSSNVQFFAFRNVSLINAAVSDQMSVVGMTMPDLSSGLANYYRAHLSPALDTDFSVLTVSLDSFCTDQRIALIKIDVEGHESVVINGMRAVVEKHHPVLIVETESDELIARIEKFGYDQERLPGSPNVVFKPNL